MRERHHTQSTEFTLGGCHRSIPQRGTSGQSYFGVSPRPGSPRCAQALTGRGLLTTFSAPAWFPLPGRAIMPRDQPVGDGNNLDALLADGELPFGHPGRRFDDTPEGFEPSPLVDQGPERDYTPDEDGRVVHYGPGERPLCGNDSMTAVYTDDRALVSGCRECLELVAEDPGDDNEYMGHCLHCRREITAQGGMEWRRVVRASCPHCGGQPSQLLPPVVWEYSVSGRVSVVVMVMLFFPTAARAALFMGARL